MPDADVRRAPAINKQASYRRLREGGAKPKRSLSEGAKKGRAQENAPAARQGNGNDHSIDA